MTVRGKAYTKSLVDWPPRRDSNAGSSSGGDIGRSGGQHGGRTGHRGSDGATGTSGSDVYVCGGGGVQKQQQGQVVGPGAVGLVQSLAGAGSGWEGKRVLQQQQQQLGFRVSWVVGVAVLSLGVVEAAGGVGHPRLGSCGNGGK